MSQESVFTIGIAFSVFPRLLLAPQQCEFVNADQCLCRRFADNLQNRKRQRQKHSRAASWIDSRRSSSQPVSPPNGSYRGIALDLAALFFLLLYFPIKHHVTTTDNQKITIPMRNSSHRAAAKRPALYVTQLDSRKKRRQDNASHPHFLCSRLYRCF